MTFFRSAWRNRCWDYLTIKTLLLLPHDETWLFCLAWGHRHSDNLMMKSLLLPLMHDFFFVQPEGVDPWTTSRWKFTARDETWLCGTADVEIKEPFVDNPELKGSPLKAWSGSVYSRACYTYCQGFLLCYFPPSRSVHLHRFQNLSWVFPVLAVNVGMQNKIGHPARTYKWCRFLWSAQGI